MNVEKRGKAKRVRKPAPKPAPKQEAEPPKPAAPEPAPAPAPAPKAPEICNYFPYHISSFSFDALLALPTIETPPTINTEDEDRRVPTIQSTISSAKSSSRLIESFSF